MELQGRVDALAASGLGLAAISYDPPAVLADFSRRRGITFPLLSDVGSATITAFGILNTIADEALGRARDDPAVAEDVKKHVSVTGSESTAKVTRGTPFPGTFIIDRSGRVISRFFEDFYRERSTTSSILLRLGTGGQPVNATRIANAQVEVTTYSSDTVVAPGNRFALVVRIAPRPGMHIYAAGASGYRPVALRLAARPFVRVMPVEYPPSEIYFFKPLNERVPVHQKPFALLQEVVLDASPAAERALRNQDVIEIDGVLDYQACDDTVCYNPALIALSWTLRLKSNSGS